jgi:hypothetical protein
MSGLKRLDDDWLRTDPARARVEIVKHRSGGLTLLSRPSIAGDRRAPCRFHAPNP